MTVHAWNEITSDDVVKAIKEFNSDNASYPEPRNTFLIYDGKKYPAKHIRWISYKVHYGKEISKSDFQGGAETARFFEKLGFEVQYHSKEKVMRKPTINKKKPCTKRPIVKEAGKISIPGKGVTEQKNALQLILNKLCDGDIVCEKTYPWMKTPSEIKADYQSLYNGLVSYRGNKGFAKKNYQLRCDFVCESMKLIIEYDERQHFSEARRISLENYPDIDLNYDKELWIKACRDIQAKDNSPADRDETRAYYDSIRDIEAARHGYSLIRIMHGQIDFEKPEAIQEVRNMIDKANGNSKKNTLSKQPLKVGLYLQTEDLRKEKEFNKAINAVKKSDIDILVFPEVAYFPFVSDMNESDVLDDNEVESLHEKALALSEQVGRAIVLCNMDKYGTITSIYANAYATEGETKYKDYFKHTMTGYSACDIDNYQDIAEILFEPIIYKGNRIGTTICYDCNHSMFSRKYGLNDVDIIINSTGGNVIYDKWFKYNKARAIENHCFTFVTMGGKPGNNNYVFGFTPEGKEMIPSMINADYDGRKNIPGAIYVYNTADYDGTAETDPSLDQKSTVNKMQDLFIPRSGISSFISKGKKISDNIRVIRHGGYNIIVCIVDGKEIMEPEKVLALLYAKELKQIPNKRYLIVNRWNSLDQRFYETKLSLILKVRSMENFCAVILEAPDISMCYQCGKNRTAQVVAETKGKYGLDLSRMGGPEVIWRDKEGMKASWRQNIEWLIDSMQ